MKTLFEQNGGTYTKVGDYYIPNLTIPQKQYNIGKYGRLYKEFLKKYRPSIYTTKLMDGTLLEYLEEIDTQAKDMVGDFCYWNIPLVDSAEFTVARKLLLEAHR